MLFEFLTNLKERRQIFLTFKKFTEQILLIQNRARSQIRLYKQVEKDIYVRLNVNIELIKDRMMDSRALTKKYPGIIKELDSIGE